MVESTTSIIDPLSFHRHGEGNIHVLDVNGDGWRDVVLSGYGGVEGDKWQGRLTDQTTILLNSNGILRAVPHDELAWVNAYQFAGEEATKPFNSNRVERMFPVDIGGDGMVDFIGFVGTPLHRWPQDEQIFTYGYVVEAKKPLGRTVLNETLHATAGGDKVWGYAGNDWIHGQGGGDSLSGGLGNDSLSGGAAADLFIFDTTLGKTNIDQVTDFNSAEGDRIQLDSAVFARLAGLEVTASNLVVASGRSAKAVEADDYLIFDTAKGALFYDADGGGRGKAVQFAVLVGVTNLNAADFEVV